MSGKPTMKCKLTGLDTKGGLGEMIQEYQKEILRLREVLEFYADEEHWNFAPDMDYQRAKQALE